MNKQSNRPGTASAQDPAKNESTPQDESLVVEPESGVRQDAHGNPIPDVLIETPPASPGENYETVRRQRQNG